jgi:hypothetical protein
MSSNESFGTSPDSIQHPQIKDRILSSEGERIVPEPSSQDKEDAASRPGGGLKRTLSEDSTDSSSTVADESWNPVDLYLPSSSGEEQNSKNAGSLFNFAAEPTSTPTSGAKQSINPEHWTWDEARELYDRSHFYQAGHKDGTAVFDAAYKTGQPPKTPEEWKAIQVARRHRKFASTHSPSNSEAPELIDLGDYTADAPQQNQDKVVDDSYTLPNATYTPPTRQPNRSADDSYVLSTTTYASPNHQPARVPTQATQFRPVFSDYNDMFIDIDSDDLAASSLFPQPASATAEQDAQPTKQMHDRPVTSLERRSARMPPRERDNRGNLDRSFRFPARSPSESSVGDEDMPEQQQTLFGRLWDVLKGFGAKC